MYYQQLSGINNSTDNFQLTAYLNLYSSLTQRTMEKLRNSVAVTEGIKKGTDKRKINKNKNKPCK